MPNYANRGQIVSAHFVRLHLQFSFKTLKNSNVFLAITGLSYSTIAVLSLQHNLGRLRNKKSHIYKNKSCWKMLTVVMCVSDLQWRGTIANQLHRGHLLFIVFVHTAVQLALKRYNYTWLVFYRSAVFRTRQDEKCQQITCNVCSINVLKFLYSMERRSPTMLKNIG